MILSLNRLFSLQELMIAAEYGEGNGWGRSSLAAITAEAEAQWTWLERTLVEARGGGKPHAFPVMHHPPFVSVPDEPSAYFNWPPAARARLLRLFFENGVTTVLCGTPRCHHHRLRRLRSGRPPPLPPLPPPLTLLPTCCV